MDDNQMKRNVGALKKWLGTPEQPVSTAEMAEFWKSLTEAEKDEFIKAVQ